MVKAVIFDMFETLITHFEAPLYFGTQMAIDAGISEDKFQELWAPTETNRTIGKMALEEAIKIILTKNDRYSKKLLDFIVGKRVAAKEDCFNHLHPEIIPLLCHLKEDGMKIGLISNCFSEEVCVIQRSILFTYFDAVCLSYDEGLQKPDPEIYKRCMDKLFVKSTECLYVGDGGSQELEAARELGMNAVQAIWYFKEDAQQPSKRKEAFIQIERPLDILNYM